MDILTVLILSAVSFGYLFLLTKLMGHRQISQLNSFDYITGITLGSIAAELATELEDPLRPAVAMVVYGGLAWLVGAVTLRWQKTRKYVEGTPSILFHNGKLYRENLKKAKLDLSEFLGMCRQQGYFDLGQIYTAVFEYNGKLSILPAEAQRPLTPQDVGRDPVQATFFTEIILDGQILGENLKRLGKDVTWLEKQLRSQGYHSEKEVFLGLADGNDRVTLYREHV